MKAIYIGACVVVVSPGITQGKEAAAVVTFADPLSGEVDVAAFTDPTVTYLYRLRESYAGFTSHCWRWADPDTHAQAVSLHEEERVAAGGRVAE